MRQKQVNRAYVLALLMSVIIYILGVGTGLYIQKTTTASTEQLIENLQRRIEGAQLEYVYISTLGERINCDALSTLVDESTQDVWEIGRELTELDNKGETGTKYYKLKEDYSILSIRGWILNSYVQQRCNKNAATILYFYSVPCSDCKQQGLILDNLRETDFKDRLLIFVLDVNVDEPIVTTLEKTYNIQATPSLVIGNTTYTGLQSTDMLRQIISKELTS